MLIDLNNCQNPFYVPFTIDAKIDYDLLNTIYPYECGIDLNFPESEYRFSKYNKESKINLIKFNRNLRELKGDVVFDKIDLSFEIRRKEIDYKRYNIETINWFWYRFKFEYENDMAYMMLLYPELSKIPFTVNKDMYDAKNWDFAYFVKRRN